MGATRPRHRIESGVLRAGLAASDASHRRVLYGRRRGRKLSAAQRELLTSLLPQLRIDVPPQGRLEPQRLFAAPVDAIWLEIGFGAGEHLAAQAAAQPSRGMVGCEVFENGIVKLLAEVRRRDLANVRLFVDDARVLVQSLAEASVERIFILFPDPWPKQRHHKRRLISAAMLDALAHVLSDGGELRLATDDMEYLRVMLGDATAHRAFEWLARRPEDWRQRPDDWPATRYEQKALGAGRQPAFLRFRRRPRGGGPRRV